MNGAAKNILIGAFVIAAGALIIFVLLFLHPSVGDEGQEIRVRFANIDKVSIGTRATYGGRAVGEVTEIKEIEDPQNARKPGKDGYVYIYELIVSVDSKVKIYNTDQISLKTSGLLGERSVEISPNPAKPGEIIRLVNKDILYAYEGGSVEQAFQEFRDLSDKIDSTLDSIKYAVDALNRAQIWQKLSTTAQNLSDITTALNKNDKWTHILNYLEHTAATC